MPPSCGWHLDEATEIGREVVAPGATCNHAERAAEPGRSGHDKSEVKRTNCCRTGGKGGGEGVIPVTTQVLSTGRENSL